MSSYKKGKIRIKKQKGIDQPISNFMSDDIVTYVYTDGSTVHNVRGSSKSRGGYGVYWGNNDKRNVGNAFDVFPITNNRCELYAVIFAVKTFISTKPGGKKGNILRIMTDSMLIVNSMTKWIRSWKARSWRKSNGKMVENMDLLNCLDVLIEENRKSFKVELYHVRAAHNYDQPKNRNSEAWKRWYGNMMADKLAKQGTTKSFAQRSSPRKLCT